MTTKLLETLTLAEEVIAWQVDGYVWEVPKAEEALAAIREAKAELEKQDLSAKLDSAIVEAGNLNQKVDAALDSVKQEPVALLQLAADALVYHTEQTRPIQNTIDALAAIQKFKEEQR